MVAPCHELALSKFREIIMRDFDNLLGNEYDYDENKQIIYIIQDLNIFNEIYYYCNDIIDYKSIEKYFGKENKINYEYIKKYLDKWSIDF